MAIGGRGIAAALPALLCLASCGSVRDGEALGNVSTSEDEALNDAAAMLDRNGADVAANASGNQAPASARN